MVEKIVKEKSFNDLNSIEACIRYCVFSGVPYQVVVSNYMTEIKGGQNIKFIKEDKSKMCFAGYAKVKSDIKKTNVHIDINKNEVSYYDVGNISKVPDKGFNIDLKAAYATVLYNSELITKATYDYICKLKKEDRLACIGMLASHKFIFDYKGKEILGMDEISSETENYFYFACEKTFQIMQKIKAICGDCYLFSWVDSVYYTDDAFTSEITAYLDSIGHGWTYTKLINLNVKEYKRYSRIAFDKAHKEEGDSTVFSMPNNASHFAKLMTKKYTSKKRGFNGTKEHAYRTGLDGNLNLEAYDYLKSAKKLNAKQRKFVRENRK